MSCCPQPLSYSRRAFMRSLGILGGLGLIGGMQGCISRNAATGKTILTSNFSASDDVTIGTAQYQKAIQEAGGVFKHPNATNIMDTISAKLIPHFDLAEFPYQYSLLYQPQVNAWALPGGFMAVNHGMLIQSNSEAELAFILAHEGAHASARHSSQQAFWRNISQLAIFGLSVALAVNNNKNAYINPELFRTAAVLTASIGFAQYSQSTEMEADKIGIRYMKKAGYNSQAAINAVETLWRYGRFNAALNKQNPDDFNRTKIYSTHPVGLDRIQKVRAYAGGKNGYMGEESYLKALDGMVLYDYDKGAFVNGNVTADVKKGYRIKTNMPAMIANIDGQQNIVGLSLDNARNVVTQSVIQITTHQKQAFQNGAKFFTQSYLPAHNLKASTIEQGTINNNNVTIATIEKSWFDGHQLHIMGIELDENNMLIMHNVSDNSHNNPIRTLVQKAKNTDIVPENERTKKGYFVHLHKVKMGDTIESLAKNHPWGTPYNEEGFWH